MRRIHLAARSQAERHVSALIAVAAALGLVGLGMLVSPEMGKARDRMRGRRDDGEEATQETIPLQVVPEPPTLHVIHGDGGTVLPRSGHDTLALWRQRRRTASTAPTPPDSPFARTQHIRAALGPDVLLHIMRA